MSDVGFMVSLVQTLPEIIMAIVAAIPQLIQAGIQLLVLLIKSLPTIISWK